MRSLFDVGDVAWQFGLLVVFTVFTGQVYLIAFPCTMNMAKFTWWISGSVGIGFTLGLVHFYTPIYRAKFAAKEDFKVESLQVALEVVLKSCWFGGILFGAITSWLIRGLIDSQHFSSTFLSLSMIVKFHIFSLLNFVLLKSVESVILYVVAGKNLCVTADIVDSPIATILSGLLDKPSFTQDSAIYELFELVLFDEARRKKYLFVEPIEDTLVIKEILSFAVNYINQLATFCRHDVALLHQLETSLLGKSNQMLRHALHVRLREALPAEQSVRKSPGIVDNIIGRVLASPSTTKRSSRQLPVPSAFSQNHSVVVPAPESSSESIPIIRYAPKLVNSSYGQALLTIWINGHQRVRHLSNYQTVECVISLLAGIAVASYDEDYHGQVQLYLDQILDCLVRLYQALCTLNAPIKGFPQCPSNTIIDSVVHSCKSAIDAVVNKFTMATLESTALKLPRTLLTDIKDISAQTLDVEMY